MSSRLNETASQLRGRFSSFGILAEEIGTDITIAVEKRCSIGNYGDY